MKRKVVLLAVLVVVAAGIAAFTVPITVGGKHGPAEPGAPAYTEALKSSVEQVIQPEDTARVRVSDRCHLHDHPVDQLDALILAEDSRRDHPIEVVDGESPDGQGWRRGRCEVAHGALPPPVYHSRRDPPVRARPGEPTPSPLHAPGDHINARRCHAARLDSGESQGGSILSTTPTRLGMRLPLCLDSPPSRCYGPIHETRCFARQRASENGTASSDVDEFTRKPTAIQPTADSVK